MEWKKRKAILAGLAFGLAAAATLSHAQLPPSRFVSLPGRVFRGEKEGAVAEALIRQRVEDWAKALRARDIDAVMSFYAPNIVSFDIAPPLRYAGTDNKRRAWQEVFARYTGAFAYEVRDLNVTTHGELAFVHSLNHVKGTQASGHITDMWVRWTACFRRIDGVWLVVHDHVSVPADLRHGKAVLNLTP
jgi:ketosteroid isomerase-like protein